MFRRQTDAFARLSEFFLHSARLPHPSQPVEMRGDGRTKCLVGLIVDPKLLARFFHQLCKSGVVDMTNSWEQIVLDLEVQATDKQGQQTIPAAMIDRGLHMMHCPGSVVPVPSAALSFGVRRRLMPGRSSAIVDFRWLDLFIGFYTSVCPADYRRKPINKPT